MMAKPVRRLLTSIKRRGGERVAAQLSGKVVRIWSGEHRAWWRPDSCGYTEYREEAGLYTFEEAMATSGHCCRMKKIAFEVAAS